MQKNENTKKAKILVYVGIVIALILSAYAIFNKHSGLDRIKQEVGNAAYQICLQTYPDNEGPFDCREYADCMAKNTTKELYYIPNIEQRKYAFGSLGAYCGEVTARY